MSQGHLSNISPVRRNLFDQLWLPKFAQARMKAKIFLKMNTFALRKKITSINFPFPGLSKAVDASRNLFIPFFHFFRIKLSSWYFTLFVPRLLRQGMFSITLATSFDGHGIFLNRYSQNARFRASISSLHQGFQVFFF